MTTRVSWKLVAAKAGASCNEARIPSHSCYFVHSRETLPPNFPDSSIFSMLRNAQLVFPDQQDSSVNRLHQCSIQIPWPELRWNGTLKMFCFSNTSFGVFPVGLMPSETQYHTRCTAEKRDPINRSAQPLQMLRIHKCWGLPEWCRFAALWRRTFDRKFQHKFTSTSETTTTSGMEISLPPPPHSEIQMWVIPVGSVLSEHTIRCRKMRISQSEILGSGIARRFQDLSRSLLQIWDHHIAATPITQLAFRFFSWVVRVDWEIEKRGWRDEWWDDDVWCGLGFAWTGATKEW